MRGFQRKFRFLFAAAFCSLACFPATVHAEKLSQRQIYERCYAKLVRGTPADGDPLASEVEAGTKSGRQACIELLRLAVFTNDRLPAYADPAKGDLARRVLQTMNVFHMSWFKQKTFEASQACIMRTTNAMFDAGEPALFVSRALFNPAAKFSGITTLNQNLRALRSENNPPYSVQSAEIERGKVIGYPAGQSLVANGDLLGITSGFQTAVDVSGTDKRFNETTPPTMKNARVFANSGGGILGSQSRFLANFGVDFRFLPNLEAMPRTWSKNVFEDFLCRPLPVISEADAKKWTVCSDAATCGIQPTASEAPSVLPFRREASCVQCHASMDQVAGVVRGMRGFRSGQCNRQQMLFSTFNWLKDPPTTGVQRRTDWGYLVDKNYAQRPTDGRFVYRTFDNKLIDQPIQNLADLGAALAATDDLYVCAAKRYLQYFTGIDADMNTMTPAEQSALPPDRKFYREKIIQLGRALKAANGEGALKLIESIFNMPQYEQRDFGLEEVTNP